MNIKCGYKHDKYCECHKKTIEEVESEIKEKCCDTCHQAVPIYTGTDKVKILYEAFKSANKEKSADEVVGMMAVYGNSSALENDFDDLYYNGYNVWLVLHKKYKYISHQNIITAYECMQSMKMKIPKRIRREMRRIKKTRCKIRKLSN